MFADPDPKYEEPYSDLDKFSLDNWRLLPVKVRDDCLAVLREKTPPDMLAIWKRQHEEGKRIGSDFPGFHFFVGMQIRNALRSVLLDEKLPLIKYEDGSEHQNWDDFYYGALQDLVSEPAQTEDILYSPIV